MRQSNTYIITFSLVLCVAIGGSLAFVHESLKDKITENKAKEKKVNILSAVTTISEGADIEALYKKSIIAGVVDVDGNIIPNDQLKNEQGQSLTPEQIDVRKEYKKLKAQRKKKEFDDIRLPIFKFKDEVDTSKIESYVFPVYGGGLWDDIWGYIAVSGDFKEISGVVFDHKAETPGLGARITNNKANSGNPDAFQERFKKGTKFLKSFDGKNVELYNIEVVKGEGNVFTDEEKKYKIDGLSGASMTTKGLNSMLANYFDLYKPYIKNELIKKGTE